MKKRLLSALLALSVLVGTAPVPVLAETPPAAVQEELNGSTSAAKIQSQTSNDTKTLLPAIDFAITDTKCDLSVTVQAKDLSDAQVSLSATSFTYNGGEQKPTVTVVLDGKTLNTADYQVNFSADTTNAGKVTVTVTGTGNYTGTAVTSYTITKKPVTATVTAADKVYDGTTDATVTATVETGIAGDALTISGLTGTFAQKDVGDDLVVTVNKDAAQITGNANYEVSIPEETTGSITPADFTCTVQDQVVRFGNGLDTVVAETAGVAGETVTGTLAWYSDANRTQQLAEDYVFESTAGNTITLYWTFTPAASEHNYASAPQNGTVTLTLQGKETPKVDKGTEPKWKTYDGDWVTLQTVTEGVTVTDANGKPVEGTWAFDGPNPKLCDIGTYTVSLIFTPKDTVNYNTVKTSIQVEIQKATITVYLLLDPNRIVVGGELPEAKLLYFGVAEGDSVYMPTPQITGMPADSQTAGTYTVKWTDADSVLENIKMINGNKENYTFVAETEAVLTISDAERLPGLEVPGQGWWEHYGLERSEMKDVPESLQGQYKSVDAIRQAMYQVACENVEGIWKENTLLWDLTLWYSGDYGMTWTEATKDHFPKEGITITLPYPEGTKREGYTFAVTHMLADGDVERCAVTNTETGVQFTVYSLSPILLGWRDINAPLVPPGGGSTSTSNNTATSPAATAAPAASGDSITYYVCPACGYHNWTAAVDGYHCDHCGYVESVKQLSGYGNVQGVYEPNAAGGSAAAVSSVIPQTGDESNPALWGLTAVVSVAVLGALLWLKRKNKQEE